MGKVVRFNRKRIGKTARPRLAMGAARRRLLAPWMPVAALVTVSAMAGYFTSETSSQSAPASTVTFKLCGHGTRINCVVDGDTIWYQGTKIRLADIDTPEVSEPKCASEKALGDRATLRLLELINAGPFTIVRGGNRDHDQYGRLLRVIQRDGRPITNVLVAEGLARRWDGRRHSWC
jgi:endonuclease YncB( thermonuclease family)